MMKKKLGEILLEMGAIDPLQLQSALGYQQQWGVPLGKAVVHKKFCSEDDVLRALSIQTGLPVIRLDGMSFDPGLAHIVPVRSAERFRAVPLRLDGKRKEVLVVAVAAPGGLETTDNILSVSGKQRLDIHLAHDDEIERAIGKLYYGREPEKRVGPAAESLVRPVGIANEELIELESTPVAPPQIRPVRIFGWHEATMRALKAMIERGGIQAIPLEDDALSSLKPDDLLIASTLGLHAALPAGARAPAKLIICGVRADVDVADAKAIGARIYLRPPFSTEQLCNAIRRVSA
ncbi:MAG: hypothetical protein WBV82_19140 [Myxococcaceae bacterium]